jgi:FolB domain-containing protein
MTGLTEPAGRPYTPCAATVQTTILITKLSLRAIVGVRPHERRRRQPLWIDVALDAHLPGLGQGDDLSLTVDYSSLHDRIVAVVETASFSLIETLARHVAVLCLEDPRVTAAEVTVRKPRALARAEAAGVRLRMVRDG